MHNLYQFLLLSKENLFYKVVLIIFIALLLVNAAYQFKCQMKKFRYNCFLHCNLFSQALRFIVNETAAAKVQVKQSCNHAGTISVLLFCLSIKHWVMVVHQNYINWLWTEWYALLIINAKTGLKCQRMLSSVLCVRSSGFPRLNKGQQRAERQ